MKKVTVTLREDVAQWARVWAARHKTSVSQMLGKILADRMLEEEGYEMAMRSFLAKRPKRISLPRTRYPRRAELHER